MDSFFEADLFLLLLLLFYASTLVVISPLAFRCHSRPSLVAYARQNLWLLRARDLGPAAAATSPCALRPRYAMPSDTLVLPETSDSRASVVAAATPPPFLPTSNAEME